MDKLRKALAVCMALTMMSVCAFSCGNDDDDTSSEKTASASQSDDDEHEEEDSEEDTEEETTKKSRRNKKDDEEETTEEETSEDTTEETTEPKGPNGASDDDTTALLPYGFFLASGDNGQFYYFFDENTSRGTWCAQEDGSMGTFDYSFDGKTATFYFDNQADWHEAKVTFVNDTTLTFDWDYGWSESLSFMNTYDGFLFHCNEALCDMALDYYEMKTGYRPGQASAEIDADNMIVIQLYDNMGDHNSTCDWYTVDRYTAKGTNLLGDTVDLTTVESQ